MRSGLLILSLAVLVTLSASISHAQKNQLPADAENVLTNATSFELYSLDPDRLRSQKAKVKFHGWKVLGSTKIKKADVRKELISKLKQGIKANKGVVAACFNPRHGIRAILDKQEGEKLKRRTVDLVICFECLSLSVYLNEKNTASVLTTGLPAATFNKVLKKAKIPLAKEPD